MEEVKEVKKTKKKRKIYKTTIMFIILDILAISCFVLVYGPWDYLRNLYVSTAMRTMEHQYLANVFYSEESIQEVLNSNYIVELNDNTDLDNIVIDTYKKKEYKDEYEKELLTREPGNDLYKIINLKVGNSDAYLVAIYDPTKVQLISKEKLGTDMGERTITMCQRYGGVVCINGGGFVDHGYGSGIPMGYVIEDGEIRWSDGDTKTTRGNIVGLTKEGKLLLLSQATGEEALQKGVVDALEFGPFLIVNGKAATVVGDAWGKAPRVAIAQRKDGVIMFLVVDGENYINGASLGDMIDTFKMYGAYNAANLDGGQSSTLIVNNKLYNNPPSAAKKTSGRYVITGFGLIP